jgi:hypothetical protein
MQGDVTVTSHLPTDSPRLVVVMDNRTVQAGRNAPCAPLAIAVVVVALRPLRRPAQRRGGGILRVLERIAHVPQRLIGGSSGQSNGFNQIKSNQAKSNQKPLEEASPNEFEKIQP